MMVLSKMKGPSKANPFLRSREAHLKCSLPHYDVILCLIVFVGGVFSLAVVLDVTLDPKRCLVFLLPCSRISGETIDLSYGGRTFFAYFVAEL